MKKCPTSLAIKKMQIKPMLRFHLTPVKIAIIKDNNKCWQGYCRTGTLIHQWWEYKLIQPLSKAVWRFLKKLKIELPYDPVILLLGICPKQHKSGYNRDTFTLMFNVPLFTIAKIWKQPIQCPITDEWIKKLWYIYTQCCFT
jgi:hypothetical protein